MQLLWQLLAFTSLVFGKPAPSLKPTLSPSGHPEPSNNSGQVDETPDTGLYYDQYLQKVVKLLESDDNFRKAMETANFDDIRDGKLSNEVNKIPMEIRRQLDEAKREEIVRLRKIAHAKMQLDQGNKIRNTNSLKEIADHLDSRNAHTFEAQDLTNLIRAASKDLENFDENRHQDFKRYEMNKALRRQEKLRQMSEADRLKAEKEYLEMRRKHEDHPAMNHPGSKAQMQEVWEEEDGLKGQDFNPKTFFNMHDINSDRMLDPMELEAIFEKDLSKVYDPNNPEDDMFEMEEERRRMREHVMKEVDNDENGLISYDEFMRYTNSEQFDKPNENSYKTVDQMIDDEELYTKEELEEFRQMVEEQEKEVKDRLEELRKQAQTVVKLKSEVYNEERKLGTNAAHHEKAALEDRKEDVKREEDALRAMHEDIKQQSREIQEMKEEIRKHEEKSQLKQHVDSSKLHVDAGQALNKTSLDAQKQQYQQPFQGEQHYQHMPPGGQQQQQAVQDEMSHQQSPHPNDHKAQTGKFEPQLNNQQSADQPL